MKYYLDCEFDGMGGPLLSMALVCEDGDEIYFIHRRANALAVDGWVRANVLPILYKGKPTLVGELEDLPAHIAGFIADDTDPEIIADWPDDFTYFAPAVLMGPGTMISIPTLTMRVVRVDAYPTDLDGAMQHNALWDARALRYKLEQVA